MVRGILAQVRIDQTVGDPGRDVQWPDLDLLPDPGVARAAAHAVRTAVLGRQCAHHPLLDLRAVASAARAEVVERDLAAVGDGCQALLIPLPTDRFRIVVDTTPREGWSGVPEALHAEVADARWRFRVGHELGHVFFYGRNDGERPSRRFACCSREEEFCDEFSRSLLLPSRAVRACKNLRELVALSVQYRVSVEVVARAFAQATLGEVALFFWQSSDERPQVQWTNVSSDWRVGRWRDAVAQAVRERRPASDCATGTMVVPGRNQALVVS